MGNIYAVGDIVPGLRWPASGLQGQPKIAGLNPTMQADIDIPRVTFCEPEIASVGAGEEARGDQVRTVEYNLLATEVSLILATS